MKCSIFSFLFGLLCAPWGFALAQTACPAGVAPGDPRCGPSPEWDQPNQAETGPQRVITREWVWEDRWGAIASDTNGPIGVANNHKTKRAAKLAATRDCVDRGGDRNNCKEIAISYHNQCAVYIYGGGLAVTAGGPDIAEVESDALAKCEAENVERRQCRVVYTGCSRAEHVGFRYY